MKIFTKMKHALLVVAAMCCVATAFAQEEEYSAVWMNDFEDATTFNEGWTWRVGGRYEIVQATGYKEGSQALQFRHLSNNNGEDYYYSPTSELLNGLNNHKDEYLLEFFYYHSAGSSSNSTITFNFTTGNFHIVAPGNSDAEIFLNGVTTSKYIPNKTWSHIYIKSKDGITTLTITDIKGISAYVENVTIAESAVILSKITLNTGKYWGYFSLDDMILSAPGAKEEISTPSISITKVNGINRFITVEPGVGTVGTAASATYYTTDGTDPSEENGNVYSAPFEISTTSTIKAISYLPDGTASEIATFEIEAGTTIPLNSNIVNVTGLAGEGDVRNAVITNVYTNAGVIGTPSVSFSYTFNSEPVELPYTVTEDGEFVATASADGYGTASETLNLAAGYIVEKAVDFTTITEDNLTEVLGDTWSITTRNTRWSGWDSSKGDIYTIATCSDANHLVDWIGGGKGTMIVGYGLTHNHNSGTNYWINNPKEGQIALYEVNQAKKATTDFVEYAVAYQDDNKLSYQITNLYTVAKVSLYSPVRELVVTDGEDLAPEYDYYTSATYTRSIAAGKYGTICLPFAPDAASLEAYNFYELTASTVSGTDGEVTFTKVDAPVANKPYIYCLADKDATEAPAITGGATEVSTEAETTIISDWQMVGSFEATTVDCTDKAIYALNSATQKLMKVTQSLSVPAYRAYIEGTSSQLNLQTLTVRISGPTGIEQIPAADVEGLLPATIYDLMGRPVQTPQKGHLYIQGGKKIVY